MTPEATMHLINYSIIVLLTTIVYCIGLIIYRAVKMVKRMSAREQEFMNSVYFKLKTKEWKKINGKISSDLALKKHDDDRLLQRRRDLGSD